VEQRANVISKNKDGRFPSFYETKYPVEYAIVEKIEFEVEKAVKYLIWKTEGTVAKLITMTFAYYSSCRLFYGDDPSQC
jgi:hypothetical protein